MAVLQVAVPVGSLDFETAVVTKKFVACGNQDIFTAERNAAQAPVGAAALEIYAALVPVDLLFHLLILKIDRKYASVTLALLTATHNGCCDELWSYYGHALVIL